MYTFYFWHPVCTVADDYGQVAFAGQIQCKKFLLDVQTQWEKIEESKEKGRNYFKLQITEIHNAKSTNPEIEIRCLTTTIGDTRILKNGHQRQTRNQHTDTWITII